MHGVNDIRKTNAYSWAYVIEVEIFIEKFKRYKSLGIFSEFIQAGEKYVFSEMKSLLPFWIRKNFHRIERNLLLYPHIKEVTKLFIITQEYHSLSTLCTILSNFFKVNCLCIQNYWGSADWILMQQIGYTAFINVLERKWENSGQCISYLYTQRRPMTWEILYSIFSELVLPMKLVRLIETCLNKSNSKVCVRKYMCDVLNFTSAYAMRKV